MQAHPLHPLVPQPLHSTSNYASTPSSASNQHNFAPPPPPPPPGPSRLPHQHDGMNGNSNGNGDGMERGQSEEAGDNMSLSPHEDTKDSTGSSKGSGSKQTKKRGRKRLGEDLDNIQSNDQLDLEAKRKLQNRAAQRAFRERKERRVTDLEEKVAQQEGELAKCRQLIAQLRYENEALRRGENPPAAPASTTDRPYSHPSTTAESHPPPSPPEVVQRPERPPNAPSPSFLHILNHQSEPPRHYASPQSEPAHQFAAPHPPPPPTQAQAAFPLAPPPSQPTSMDFVPNLPPPPHHSETPPMPLDFDVSQPFDFDAPFDFSESMALPPLFASFLDDISLPPPTTADPHLATGASNAESLDCDCDNEVPGGDEVREGGVEGGEGGSNGNENDDDEPPPLPHGRIPCDKPECDFTAVSCALPIPWRPPNARGEDKDLWIAQKCWAKLVSHPLFDRCDSDELCQELRDKTRCSDDGRIVIHKDDICHIFRSIPQKVKLRQMRGEV